MEESRPTEAEDPVADPAARPTRRTYPAEYRARVLAEYEAAPHGQKSAVLRREGIYQTLVAEWAKARDAEAAGTTYQRVRKSRSKDQTESARAVKLEVENQRLTRQLAQTQAALDVMGKVHGLLELLSERRPQSPPETGPTR
jgi:transposase-like protein